MPPPVGRRAADTAHGLLVIGAVGGAVFAGSVLAASLALGPRPEANAARLRLGERPLSRVEPPALPAAVAFDRTLIRPVEVADGALRDSFGDARGRRAHGAVDLAARRGSPVVAVDDGTILRLGRSAAGGIAVDHLDPTGRYCYYYAHLAGYAPGLASGQRVRRGQVIGYVGSTGNASPGAPHLHFAIFRTGARPSTCGGTPINPYPYLR